MDNTEQQQKSSSKPRTAGKINADYGLSDILRRYKQTTPTKLRASDKIFRALIHDLNNEIATELLNGNTIKMPFRLGHIYIHKHKQTFSDVKKLRIDWAATKRYKKTMFHLNEHRNGFTYRFQWSKGAVLNQKGYSIIMVRSVKRRLANILLTKGEMDYHESPQFVRCY